MQQHYIVRRDSDPNNRIRVERIPTLQEAERIAFEVGGAEIVIETILPCGTPLSSPAIARMRSI